MQKSYECPQCGNDVQYLENQCPNCKLRSDWVHQPPIPAMEDSDKKQNKHKFEWFGRHINWTWALALVILIFFFPYTTLFGLLGWPISLAMNPSDAKDNSANMMHTWNWIMGFFFLIPICRVFVKEKGHNGAYAAFCLVPLGFIVVWVLKNKRAKPKEDKLLAEKEYLSNLSQEQILTTGNGKNSRIAVVSFVLGIVGLIAWFIPLVGFPVAITGIVLSAIGLNSSKRGMAISGLVMSIICFTATITNSIVGGIMAALGLHL